jgi:RNA polymerase sigma factor (sigma-70 family)
MISDAALLARSASGPEADAAFETLVARHGPMVLATCRSLLRDPEDVADACQLTYLALARKAGTIRVDESLGPWLRRVAKRTARRLRRSSSRAPSSMDVWQEPTEEPIDVERSEAVAIVREEVERLPERLREAVQLCYVSGLTHEEAARALRLPLGTLKTRLLRAREVLRDRLVRRGLAPVAVLLLLQGMVSGGCARRVSASVAEDPGNPTGAAASPSSSAACRPREGGAGAIEARPLRRLLAILLILVPSAWGGFVLIKLLLIPMAALWLSWDSQASLQTSGVCH